ncbi:hypothetical protein Tco_0012705 [Tanacetum coccineum]
MKFSMVLQRFLMNNATVMARYADTGPLRKSLVLRDANILSNTYRSSIGTNAKNVYGLENATGVVDTENDIKSELKLKVTSEIDKASHGLENATGVVDTENDIKSELKLKVTSEIDKASRL